MVRMIGMRLPVWLVIGVAALVCVFGAYRIRLAFRSEEENARSRARKGLYAMARRTHFLIGVIYLLLGAGLIATTFGWNPFGNLFGPPIEAPTKIAPKPPTPAAPADPTPASPAPTDPAPPK
jgi:hypothetical protein